MGNALRCFEGEDDHGGRDHYPYYRPTSGPTHVLQSGIDDEPASPPSPTHQQIRVGPHGVDHYVLNFKPTSMAAVPNSGHLHGSSEVYVFHSGIDDEPASPPSPTHQQTRAAVPKFGHLHGSSEVLRGKRVVAPRYQCNTEDDIDESSAVGLWDAASYAKANEMLIQVPVLGTTKSFWRLSDEATRISRNLALILSSHHSVDKYLAAPLQVSNVWISSSARIVKLRGVRFTGKRGFSIEHFRYDYMHLSRVLQKLIHISGANITKLPPDYKEFLMLLKSDTITKKDEFLIVNNPALLPMSNRTEVFLMLYDKIVTCLGRTKAGEAKQKRILSNLPYKNDWLETATANGQINQWISNVPKKYKKYNKYNKTQLDQLRLNRNVRSHLHQYNDENIEEILYCEWPELLMGMAKMLHMEGELQGTHIQNKFG